MRLIAFTVCALVAAPVAALAQELPPGPGADLIQKSCQNCHGLDTVTGARNNLDGWRSTVAQMIGNGASLTDAEAETVSQYLATNFGFGPPAAGDAAAPAAPSAPAAPGAAPSTPAAPADATTPATPAAPAAPAQAPPTQ